MLFSVVLVVYFRPVLHFFLFRVRRGVILGGSAARKGGYHYFKPKTKFISFEFKSFRLLQIYNPRWPYSAPPLYRHIRHNPPPFRHARTDGLTDSFVFIYSCRILPTSVMNISSGCLSMTLNSLLALVDKQLSTQSHIWSKSRELHPQILNTLLDLPPSGLNIF